MVSSFVTRSRPSATAWAIRIRSNGSLCSIGSAANAVTWLARTGSTWAAVSSVARRDHVERAAIVNSPLWVLMTTSQYDARLMMFSPASTRWRARADRRSGDPSAQRSVLVSSRWMDLAPAPERFGFFIGERPFPAVGHLELPAHRAKRCAVPANRHELRHGAAMPLDHDLLAIFDEVEELRQLCLRAVNADVHRQILVHFLD